MHRRFNPIFDGPPTPFYEDVYLLDKLGKVIFCRQGSDRKIKNIYDLIDKDELNFIEENASLSNINPLLLVAATDTLLLLDLSLLIKKGIFIAIIPHFSKEQTLEIIKSACCFVLASPKIKGVLHSTLKRELRADECAFAERLKMLYLSEIYNSQVHGRTNIELADMMLRSVNDFSCFVGCDLECFVHGVSVFELKNELCIYSYKFMLLIICFLARKYSEERCARIDICFDEMGISMNAAFEIADIYKKVNFVLEATELMALMSSSQNDKFLFECLQSDRELLLCGYLWQHSADYEHVKKNLTDIKYNTNSNEGGMI